MLKLNSFYLSSVITSSCSGPLAEFPPIELPDSICQHKGLDEAEWLLCRGAWSAKYLPYCRQIQISAEYMEHSGDWLRRSYYRGARMPEKDFALHVFARTPAHVPFGQAI